MGDESTTVAIAVPRATPSEHPFIEELSTLMQEANEQVGAILGESDKTSPGYTERAQYALGRSQGISDTLTLVAKMMSKDKR